MAATPEIEIVIEVPRGAFVRRDAAGRIAFVSPLPCPFNYGAAPGLRGEDGEALDVVALGPRRPVGARLRLPPRAVVRFVDAGVSDDKLVCAAYPPGRLARLGLLAFFHGYACAKRLLRLGRGGRVACEGWGDVAATLARAAGPRSATGRQSASGA